MTASIFVLHVHHARFCYAVKMISDLSTIIIQTQQVTEDGFFQNVGLGAVPLDANQAASQAHDRDSYTGSNVFSHRSTSIPQTEEGFIDDSPWSPLVHQFNPNFTFVQGSASGKCVSSTQLEP